MGIRTIAKSSLSGGQSLQKMPELGPPIVPYKERIPTVENGPIYLGPRSGG